MITFVAFYVAVSQQTMANIHQSARTITVTEPFRFIQAMFSSARQFHPESHFILLSDENTLFPSDSSIEIIRFQLDAKQPMLSRSEAWLSYLEQANSHVIFLDSDILINARLDHVFSVPFDVALTYRDDEKWPINAGINFVHGDYLLRGRAFYQKWLDDYKAQHLNASVWGGDQDVLRDLLKGVDYQRTDCFTHEQEGFKIRLLPCSSYNFSSEVETAMTEYYPDKNVLHFKGRRKSAMLPYMQSFLNPD